MREIKFRAWDGELKEMIAPEEVLSCSFIGLDGEWLGLSDLLKGEGGFELMQYTGLKDKNGIEIYEVDIIKCRIVTPKRNWKELRTVAYDEDMARFAAVSLDGNHWSSLPSNVEFNLNPVRIDKCKIIGNIYENSELLEAKE